MSEEIRIGADVWDRLSKVIRYVESLMNTGTKADEEPITTTKPVVILRITSTTTIGESRWPGVLYEMDEGYDRDVPPTWAEEEGTDCDVVFLNGFEPNNTDDFYVGIITEQEKETRNPVVLAIQGGGGMMVDTVHVVGTEDSWTVRRVTRGDDGVLVEWEDGDGNPKEYTNVYESEDRLPRWVDGVGECTHAIPLYRDVDGNYYIQFWKTCTFYDKEELTDVTFAVTQNPPPACTFNVVRTRTFTTYRHFIDVMPMGTRESGLRLRIGSPVSLTDTCSSE